MTVVARAFGCSRKTWSVADRPRPGPRRVTSQREDRYIRLRHLRDRFATATSTSMELLEGRVTADTIRNRLRTAGLRARRPYFGPIHTRVHRQQRPLWARRHVRFTQRQWNTMVFSDKSRFTLSFADGRIRAWRRRGERHAHCCVREVDRFGGGSLMVCGCIHQQWKVKAGRHPGEHDRPSLLRPSAQAGPGAIHP